MHNYRVYLEKWRELLVGNTFPSYTVTRPVIPPLSVPRVGAHYRVEISVGGGYCAAHDQRRKTAAETRTSVTDRIE